MQCLFSGQGIHCCVVLWHQGSRIPCGKVGAATPLHSSAAGNAPSEHIRLTPMESFTIRFCQINLVRSFRQRSSNNSECFPCSSAKARRTAVLVFNQQQSQTKGNVFRYSGEKWVGDVEQQTWCISWEGRSFNKFLYSKRKSIQDFYHGHPLCGSVSVVALFILHCNAPFWLLVLKWKK